MSDASAAPARVTNQTYRPGAHPTLRAESVFLYRPATDWTYSHHAHLTFFRDRFVAAWSNGRQGEDEPGQRVLFATSKDFWTWTTPEPLVDSLPGEKGTDLVLTAAGFHQHAGTLVAYFGQYENDRTHTRLRALTTTEGENWGPLRDLNVPVNPNHGPQTTSSGRLLIAGNFAFPRTDDPRGLSGWTMASFHTPETGVMEDNPATFWKVAQALRLPAALCEGSFYQTDDGVLHMLLRATGDGWRGRLWRTESRDDGNTWSRPTETAFSDNDAKFHLGRLPDGRFFYVGCPDTANRGARTPLVLSLSNDGANFDRHFVLADDHFPMRRSGKWKNGEFGYPHTLFHDGFLTVIVSRQKEAVEVIRFALDQRKGLTE